MEKYDVAIIGGGSAGLAALKQLSHLGKQAILLEAGSAIGTKNISGGWKNDAMLPIATDS